MSFSAIKSEKLFAGNNKIIWKFFARLFLLILVWQSCYQFLLKPMRIPDKFLTDFITACVAKVLNIFSASGASEIGWASIPGAAALVRDGKHIFFIADACNALDLMVIYLALIVLLPYPGKRKLLFGVGGLVVIIVFNVVRCLSLYYIYFHNYVNFHFNHHYVFSLLMYLVIFGLWILFTNKKAAYEVS